MRISSLFFQAKKDAKQHQEQKGNKQLLRENIDYVIDLFFDIRTTSIYFS